MTTRWIYLHGFASGPESGKGRSISAHFLNHGVFLERLNLRVPSFECLRLTAMIDRVHEAMDGADEVVLFGSSLGGLVACRAAEGDPRVKRLVLLAPAFRMIEHWRLRLGEEAWAEWQQTGWLAVDDYASGTRSRVDFGFCEDVQALDRTRGVAPRPDCPALIVHGRGDAVVDVARSREWAVAQRERGHDVRLVEVDDGHELTGSVQRIVDESREFLGEFIPV